MLSRQLEKMLLIAAESEGFGSWNDSLSELVGGILLRYPAEELGEGGLFLAAGGTVPFPPVAGKKP